MSTHLLLEAAVRSLVMGAIILVALRALRIEQVRARRTAWLLALAGALAMPALVAAQIGPRLLPEFALAALPAPESPTSITSNFAGAPRAAAAAWAPPPLEIGSAKAFGAPEERGAARDPVPPPARAYAAGGRGDTAQFGNAVITLGTMATTLVVFGYCVVAAVLMLRLCLGVGFAVRLRNQAKRVMFPFDPALDVRTTQRLATPATIGSSVLLPNTYSSWDGATLRIVLTHERAHVRQKDFYVHTLAGLHCALFWFNPFSWWLQRELSELGEALSDCAAAEQAESRTSYAETLLAFATRTRWPMSGVAMASTSNLTPRIERLLNDRGFERSFAPRQRLPFVAAGIVILAMVASTSTVRVHAASAVTDAAAVIDPAVSEAAVAGESGDANTGVANIGNIGDTNTDTQTKTDVQTKTDTQTTTDTHPAKKSVKVRSLSNKDFDADKSEAGDRDTFVESDDGTFADDEEGILAIHSGHSRVMFDSGNWLPRQHGDYIYFQHQGKPYLIQDPQVIAKAQAMLEPMKALGEKQKELGRQQSLLGAQQRMLASQERGIKLVESPEFKRQMAELEKTIKELDLPRLTAQVDERALSEMQAHLGEIQARVGELQSQFGREQGKFGEKQGELGEQQGKLGEQQALLGEQQRKIVEDVRRQLKPIIEQAIRDGKGKLISTD
ncbi:MAG TPA: M56 family metallopeptidase [Steroidobacteraceae bacterium]